MKRNSADFLFPFSDLDHAFLGELIHPIRIHILNILNLHGATSSVLTEKIGNISNSEISRHLSRLGEKNLIHKASSTSRNYEITPFGRSVVKILSPLLMITKNFSYFSTHSMEFLPNSLLHKIDSIRSSRLVEGTGFVMKELQVFMELPANKYWLMVDTPYPFWNKNASYSMLLPKEILNNKPKNLKESEKGLYSMRLLPNTPITMAMCDLGIGMISFPRMNEKTADLSYTFMIEEKSGFNYLKEIWNFFWTQAENFDF